MSKLLFAKKFFSKIQPYQIFIVVVLIRLSSEITLDHLEIVKDFFRSIFWFFVLLFKPGIICTIIFSPLIHVNWSNVICPFFLSLFNSKWRGIRQLVEERFFACKNAWANNDLVSIKGSLDLDLYIKMKGLLRNTIGESKLNILEDIEVKQVYIKRVSLKKNEFSAVVSASMKDYIISKKTGKKTKWSNKEKVHHINEIWIFKFDEKYQKWILLSVGEHARIPTFSERFLNRFISGVDY